MAEPIERPRSAMEGAILLATFAAFLKDCTQQLRPPEQAIQQDILAPLQTILEGRDDAHLAPVLRLCARIMTTNANGKFILGHSSNAVSEFFAEMQANVLRWLNLEATQAAAERILWNGPSRRADVVDAWTYVEPIFKIALGTEPSPAKFLELGLVFSRLWISDPYQGRVSFQARVAAIFTAAANLERLPTWGTSKAPADSKIPTAALQLSNQPIKALSEALDSHPGLNLGENQRGQERPNYGIPGAITQSLSALRTAPLVENPDDVELRNNRAYQLLTMSSTNHSTTTYPATPPVLTAPALPPVAAIDTKANTKADKKTVKVASQAETRRTFSEKWPAHIKSLANSDERKQFSFNNDSQILRSKEQITIMSNDAIVRGLKHVRNNKKAVINPKFDYSKPIVPWDTPALIGKIAAAPLWLGTTALCESRAAAKAANMYKDMSGADTESFCALCGVGHGTLNCFRISNPAICRLELGFNAPIILSDSPPTP